MIRHLGMTPLLVAALAVSAPAVAQQMPGRIGVHLEQIDRATGAVLRRESFTCAQPDPSGPGCVGPVTLMLDGQPVPLLARAHFASGYAFLTLREAAAPPAYAIEPGDAEPVAIPAGSRHMASRLMTLQLFPAGAVRGPMMPPVLRRSGLPSLHLRVTVLQLED
ncbi:hypothetical protein ACVFYP_20120 [Roseomonas sp. F4]